MLKKSLFLGVICMVVFLSGCEQLKGPKGDKGDKGETGSSGLIGTKTYTGVPNSNPYEVSCPEITDLSKQVVECYMRSAGGDLSTGVTKLPITAGGYSHMVMMATGKVAFVTQKVSDNSLPTYALSNPDTSFYGAYTIEIKTFASAPAKSAYLAQHQKSIYKGSTADYINNILQW